MIRPLLRLFALVTLAPAPALAAPETLTSPNGRVVVVVDQDRAGVPTYSVRFGGRLMIAPSTLGLDLKDGGSIGRGAVAQGVARSSHDRTYQLVSGKTSVARDRHNQLVASYATPAGRRFDIIFRAHDDGVALRYRLAPAGDAPVAVAAEQTRFMFPEDFGCWGLNLGRFGTSHEGEYDPTPASRIRSGALFEAPLLCRAGRDGPALAIAEADLKGWSGLYLGGLPEGGVGVAAQLAPRPDEPGVAVRTLIGAEVRSPWRVIMLADRPVDLIESTLIVDLNPAPAFDAGWIRPGKTAWDWWNGTTLAAVPNAGMNDATVRGFIDFAAKSKLEYMLIDDGWYVGSGLAGTVRPGSDATRSIAGINLPELVSYADRRGVGLWLWVHWRVMDAQMDEALALYQRLGIKGVKVDFMDRDDQPMVEFIHRLLAKAAERKLMVNLHGMYHPTGLNRTYPNLLTQEGVLGAEFNKWSRRITATHNVTLPFTRMLLGPMDYTPGGFRNVRPADFRPEFEAPMVQTSRAAALAMYVVYESGLACVSDSPDVYSDAAGFDFVSGAPATWDETEAIEGEVGSHVVIARRRGRDWWLGAMTNERPRTVRVALSFLGVGRYRAVIHQDDVVPTALRTETREVDAGKVLDLTLAGSGGAAVRFERIGR